MHFRYWSSTALLNKSQFCLPVGSCPVGKSIGHRTFRYKDLIPCMIRIVASLASGVIR